jgi:hypothetical protein
MLLRFSYIFLPSARRELDFRQEDEPPTQLTEAA